MKKIMIISVLLITATLTSLQAQDINSMNGEELANFYSGTWKYENTETKETFVMKLTNRLEKDYFGEYYYTFYGAYSYSKNGKKIYDNLKAFEEHKGKEVLSSWRGYNIYFLIIAKGTVNHYMDRYDLVSFVDGIKGTDYHSTFMIMSTEEGKEKLKMELHIGEWINEEYDNKRAEDFSVPRKMVLTKVH